MYASESVLKCSLENINSNKWLLSPASLILSYCSFPSKTCETELELLSVPFQITQWAQDSPSPHLVLPTVYCAQYSTANTYHVVV